MNIRQRQEAFERQWLSPMASLAAESRGRNREEVPCDIRTIYQRDRDRIIHSKAFRRLKHKTQVFIAPEGDHYRTRLTHTLEVAQIGRTIARALRLNEDLTEAIALGHDLGHTPFGHAGEDALDQVCTGGFKHYEQSLRVVEVLENKGQGLNLSWEVRDGIMNHPTKGKPSTMEGKIIRLSDKIAYINHDIDDAIRGRILQAEDLPGEYLDVLGHSSKERIGRMIHDIIEMSEQVSDIAMSPHFETSMKKLRKFMFQNVYIGSKAKEHEDKAMNMLIQLYRHFMDNPAQLPDEYRLQAEERSETVEQAIVDYIAGMTDRYAINLFIENFVPSSWKD